jgi:hypothetical protein
MFEALQLFQAKQETQTLDFVSSRTAPKSNFHVEKQQPADTLPIPAGQTSMPTTRWFLNVTFWLCHGSCWHVFHGLCGSTSALAGMPWLLLALAAVS